MTSEQVLNLANRRVSLREEGLREYVASVALRPLHTGDHTKGEITLVTGYGRVVEHQLVLYVRALNAAQKRGDDLELLDLRPWDLGISYSDSYYHIARDPVIFPGGMLASYIIVFYAGATRGERSTHMLFVTASEHKLVLNRVFRYQQDCWVLESAGTVTRPSETQTQAIGRLMKEKHGRELITLERIGEFSPERGCIADTVDHRLALVGPRLNIPTDPIYANVVELTLGELLDAMREGVWTDPATGTVCKVNDDYLAATLTYGFLRGCFTSFSGWSQAWRDHL